MIPNIVIFNLILFSCASSNPIIIKSGIVSDRSSHGGDNIYDLSSKKGISLYEGDKGFNKDNEGKFIAAQDFGKYGQDEEDRKHYIDQRKFDNENFKKQSTSDVENNNNKAAHKKGHHKSGFHNSYHKEESGSKSNYYDDSDDEGGQYHQNTRQGDYGDSEATKNDGSYLDGSKYYKDNSKHGKYNNEGLYDKNFGTRRNYNQDKYYDDISRREQSNAGNQYGESGRYEEAKYHKPYYNNYESFSPDQLYYPSRYTRPTKTITIYDDPREYRTNTNHFQYDNYPRNRNYDIVLDVKRPLQNRYYDERRDYDDYYY